MVDLDLVYRNRNVWKAQELCNWCGGNWDMGYFILGIIVTLGVLVTLAVMFCVPISEFFVEWDFNKKIEGAVQNRTRALNVFIQDLTQKLDQSLKATVCAEEYIKQLERAQYKADTEFDAYVRKLEALKEHEPLLATPAHLEMFAVKNKDTLLKNRARITNENLIFRTLFLPMLKEHKREDLIPFAEWERKALAIAERLDVETPKKPKLTEAEVRAFKVRRKQRDIDDKIALGMVELDSVLKVRSFLDQYELDPEERENYERNLIDELQEQTNGNNTKSV